MIFNLLLDEQPQSGQGALMLIILVVVMIGMFVWSSISNKKKQKEAQNMVSSLKVGDRVKTIGGVCGFVAEINDKENTFVLRTGMEGKESFVKFDKGAIYQTAPANGNANPEVKEEPAKTEKKADKKSAKKVDNKEEVKAEEKAEKVEEVKEETVEETVEQPKEEK
ncbi:MAG: preprotein translocase subunit YajC [Clostridiales bacterium]|nr:preprotein translocase subunit YajC [Clostridiales bacterium]